MCRRLVNIQITCFCFWSLWIYMIVMLKHEVEFMSMRSLSLQFSILHFRSLTSRAAGLQLRTVSSTSLSLKAQSVIQT